MKRPELLLPVASQLNGGSAHRQIARNLGCSPSTVTRIAVRLGAHAKLFQQKMLAMIDEIQEDIVYDHFESFIGNQSNRHAIGTAVGSLTWLVYDIRGVRYRGALRRSQRKRPLRSKPKATEPGAYTDSIVETLNILASKSPRGLTLITDDHPLYKSAIRKINAVSGLAPAITHLSFANPDRGPGHDKEVASKRDRALFAVDLLHKIWRHSHAHHRRETIAFGRKESNAMGRSALFAVWRNFVKRISERRPTRLTPAIKAKLTDRAWTWAEVFSERLFRGRT